MTLTEAMRANAASVTPELVNLRRRLHRRPEIGLDLPETQSTVLEALDGLDLEITLGRSLSSVTAVLRGQRKGGAVLLRGDMDALPLQEETGLDFASEVDGAMHACGHDLHTAMLVGAAKLLHRHREALHGDVVFMFQPGEEGWDGAGRMIAEGVLNAAGPPVSAAYGIHVMATRPAKGVFTTRPGSMMAASDRIRVTVHGRGGHGSAPHLSLDPVPAAAEMVASLQTLVTRSFDIFDPVVVTVGQFHAGTARNIIPDEAYFEATVRTFSEPARNAVREASVRLCEGIGAAYGLRVEAVYEDEYPLTINDAGQAEAIATAARQIFGPSRFAPLRFPLAGSEDFSRVLAEVPGSYVFLGAGTPEAVTDNHSPRAVFDDSVCGDGALLHAVLATTALQGLTESPGVDEMSARR